MEINHELGAEIGAAIQAMPKDCWRNAVMALFYLEGEAYYVEGHVLICGAIYVEHGWLEVRGEIVDPTLHDTLASDYHPIFRYSQDEIEQIVNKKRGSHVLPFYAHDHERRSLVNQAQYDLYQTLMQGEANGTMA